MDLNFIYIYMYVDLKKILLKLVLQWEFICSSVKTREEVIFKSEWCFSVEYRMMARLWSDLITHLRSGNILRSSAALL